MGIRKRKQRKESECHPAVGAAATPNPDPAVMLVVRLLATTPVPNDRIALTDRTKAYDDLVAVVGPAGSKLLQPGRHWDKEDRYLKGASLSDVDPPRSQPAAKLLLLKKIQLKENIASYCQPRSRGSVYWPVISLKAPVETEISHVGDASGVRKLPAMSPILISARECGGPADGCEHNLQLTSKPECSHLPGLS